MRGWRRWVLLVLWASAPALLSCTTQSTTCGGGSCPSGCCNGAGACVPGSADDACGIGGEPCTDCTAEAGVCFAQACMVLPPTDAGAGDGGH